MLYLIYERESGSVVGSVEADSPPQVLDHHAALKVDSRPADIRCVAVEKGKLVTRVDPNYVKALKASKVKAIERARDAKLAAGFETDCGIVQADSLSRTNLTDAAVRALLDPINFKVKWRMADNKMVDLKAADMTKMAAQLSAFVDQVYQRSFTLKGQLQVLTTVEAVKALEVSF